MANETMVLEEMATLGPVPGQVELLGGGASPVVERASRVQAGRSEFMYRAGQRPGVPLDVTTGVSKGLRFKLGFARDTDTQAAIVRSEYPGAKVETSPNGELVIRDVIDPNTFKRTDMTVRPLGRPDVGGMLTEAIPSTAIETAGTVASLYGGGKLKLASEIGRRFRDIVFGAIGGNLAGVAQDVGTRLAVGQPVSVEEITDARSKRIVADAVADTVLTGVGAFFLKAPSRMLSPFGSARPELQQKALAAADRLKDQSGVEIPFSPGEATGNPLLQRAEVFTAVAGGGRTQLEQRAAREHAISQVEQFMLGNRPLPRAQDVGNQAVNILQDAVDRARLEAGDLSVDVVRGASKKMDEMVRDLTLFERGLYATDVGRAQRAGVAADLAARKAKASELYNKLYSIPAANEAIIPTAPLKKFAKALEASLPTKAKKPNEVVEDVGELFSPTGERLPSVSTEGREVVKEWVPSGLLAKLKSLQDLDDHMPIQQLVQMRQYVNDMIDQGAPFQELSKKRLTEFSHAITETIESGIENLGKSPKLNLAYRNKKTGATIYDPKARAHAVMDPDLMEPVLKNPSDWEPGFTQRDTTGKTVFLKTDEVPDSAKHLNEAAGKANEIKAAYDEARKYYRELRERFDDPLLHELASKPDAQGYLLDENIVAKAASSPSSMKTLQKFFGPDSAEFNLLRRGVMDDIMRRASWNGSTDLVDGAALGKTLSAMDPELRKILLGPKEADFMTFARELGVFQGKLDPKEFLKAAERGPKGLEGYLAWQKAQDKADTLYRNGIIRAVTHSDTVMPSIEPGEFIDKFVYQADPPMVAQVMNEIASKDPKLAEDIRAKVLEGIFNKMDTAKSAEALQGLGVRTVKDVRGLDPKALKKSVFSDERTIAQMQEVFGAHGTTGANRSIQVALPPPGTQQHLKALLGNDTLQQLSDLADVLAVDVQKETMGRAVGGLSGGAAIANANLPRILAYRTVSKLMASPTLRKYVTARVGRPDATRLSQALIAAQPALESAAYSFASESGFMKWLDELYSGLQGETAKTGGAASTDEAVEAEKATLK